METHEAACNCGQLTLAAERGVLYSVDAERLAPLSRTLLTFLRDA